MQKKIEETLVKGKPMRMFFCSLVFLFSSIAISGDLPIPALEQSSVTKDMVWNKWETENFVVLSIDYDFGRRLKSSIEETRLDFCRSWGVKDERLPVKCKIVCVPDPTLLKKFFSLDGVRQEVKRDISGSVTEMSIWFDQVRFDEFPSLVASICLYDRPLFIKRGVPKIISLTPSKISEMILSSAGSPSSVLRISEEEFHKNSSSEADGNSIVACLFFRKEFGLALFSKIKRNESEFGAICGFSDSKSFEATLKRYSENLKSDLKSGKTPKSYLSP